MQLVDKTTRNRIFNSRYWKEECFALNAQTLIDKAVAIKYIGGLYSGAKKPTKYLCLFFKMLQMNLSKQFAYQYLKATQHKYLNAIALLYLRFIIKAPQIYTLLQPFYADNRKLLYRDSEGKLIIMHVDQFVEQLLNEQVCLGLTLPFIPKRISLENQGILAERVSILQQEDDQQQEDQQMKSEQING